MKLLPLATPRRGLSDILLALALLMLLLLLADPSRGQSESPYGYLRTLEGSATLIAADAEEGSFAASINQPVLPGDRLSVDPGARLEVVLPEGTRVRAGGGAQLYFAILGSTEEDSGPRVQLDDGELQFTVPNAAAGSATPRIDTGNASVYAVEAGQFSIVTRSYEYTLVNVRSGAIEVLTPRGSSYVRTGEALVIQGQNLPEVNAAQPAAWSSLETWGRQLDEQLAYAQVPEELDGDLAYDAAALEGHGTWVDVEGQYAWRPGVRTDWQPYTAGHWYYTPAGLTWVSSEPWGWVTYHYGSWSYASHYGWVWYPARRWAPAWVYWYWGPTYVGWCPVGVYTDHYWPRYGHYGFDFRWGSYGWAGGSWSHYQNWTFVSHDRLHERNIGRFAHRRAADTRLWGRDADVPRGFITTDTSGLSRDAWKRPSQAAEVLSRGAASTRPGSPADRLPDVTSFVARKGDLSPEVERRVLTRDSGGRSIMAPANERQAVRRAGSTRDIPSSTVGRAVARTPDGRQYEAVDVTRDSGRPVSRSVGVSEGTESWRGSSRSRGSWTDDSGEGSVRPRGQAESPTYSRDPRGGVDSAPNERGVRAVPRSGSESSSWRSGRETTGRPDDSVRAAPRSGSESSSWRSGRETTGRPDDSVRAAPRSGSESSAWRSGREATGRPDSSVRSVPDVRSDWRRQSTTREIAPRSDAGRDTTSAPPVRRVIDAVRGAPSAPVQRYTPPTSSSPSNRHYSPPTASSPPSRYDSPPTASAPSTRSPVSTRSAPSESPSDARGHGYDSRSGSSDRSPHGASSSHRDTSSSARSSSDRSSSRDSGSRGRASSSRKPH